MKNIQINSKFVKSGDAFVAIPCDKLEENIKEAFDNGASVVFSERSKDKKVIIVSDARLTVSRLAKFRYSEHPEICVSLTGTNGKSSVAHFLKQIWQYSGKKAANLGTLGLFINDSKINPEGIDVPNLTTPDPVTLHKIMAYLKNIEKVSHFVFEASSHALDQKRLHSTDLNAAAFTNFASDHLDYHNNRKDYLEAKLKLFEDILDSSKPAIVSKDYPEIYEAVSIYNKNIISFGLNDKNFIRAENVTEFPNKIIFDLIFGDVKFEKVSINLFGNFQIMNILCAIALAHSTGMDPKNITMTLDKIKPLDGRMEHIRSINGGDVFVDYAHTTEGFQNALACFKKSCKGKLICVFGCGGDRDKSKRSEMGEVANNIADVVIVTDDNPRTEAPSSIRSEIISKCRKAIEIGNRKDAIEKALEMITPGDFVAIIGKGHEDYQIYKDETIHFSDKETVLNYKA